MSHFTFPLFLSFMYLALAHRARAAPAPLGHSIAFLGTLLAAYALHEISRRRNADEIRRSCKRGAEVKEKGLR